MVVSESNFALSYSMVWLSSEDCLQFQMNVHMKYIRFHESVYERTLLKLGCVNLLLLDTSLFQRSINLKCQLV